MRKGAPQSFTLLIEEDKAGGKMETHEATGGEASPRLGRSLAGTARKKAMSKPTVLQERRRWTKTVMGKQLLPLEILKSWML